MPSTEPTALIIDDDPSHLKIYSWVVNRAGFQTATLLVRSSSFELPDFHDLAVVVMDYQYNSAITALQIFHAIRAKSPNLPIFLLSEYSDLPEELIKCATAFIKKSEPQTLVERLIELRETGKVESRF